MDKTNINNSQVSTHPNRGQLSANGSPAGSPQPRVDAASLASVQEAAPSLGSAQPSTIRSVQAVPNARLDVSVKLLESLYSKIDTDTTATNRIVELLNKKDPTTQETLSRQLMLCNHTNGLAFVEKCTLKLKDLLKNASQAIIIDDCAKKYILDALCFPVDGQSLFTLAYKNNCQEDIELIEGIISKFLNCLSKKPEDPIGLFELTQVINETSLAPMLDYFITYPLKFKEGLSREQKDRQGQKVIQQYALYFLYAFLSKDSGLLRSLKHGCNALSTRFGNACQKEAYQQIASVFQKILNDLRHTYLEKHSIQHTDYEDLILDACRAFPELLNLEFRELSQYAAFRPSKDFLKTMIALETADKQCFLDLMYQRLCSFEGRLESCSVKQSAALENFIFRDIVNVVEIAPVMLNLDLPHLVRYLSTVSIEKVFSADKIDAKLFQYLLLSILSKNVDCVSRFKDLKSISFGQNQSLVFVLVRLMQHYFEKDSLREDLKSKTIDRVLDALNFAKIFPISEAYVEIPEVFFEILKALEGFSILKDMDLISSLLSINLDEDLRRGYMDGSTPHFDYILGRLQHMGFDLHTIDPDTGHNLLAEVFEVPSMDLVEKLIQVGCNPFLKKNDGYSLFTALPRLPIQPSMRDVYLAWKRKGLSIMKLLKLDDHRFLSKEFQANIKRGKCIQECDTQGRTPLMLYVMINKDIQAMFGERLEKLDLVDLEAKDHKGWTVFDYANHNNDQKTLDLLNSRKKALEKKSKKTNIFRQAAGLAVQLATPKAPTVEATTPKASPAPSSSSKRRQARQAKKAKTSQETGSPVQPAATPEITINYNAETGTSTTSIKTVHNQAAEAIAKEEAKKTAKQNKDKQNTLEQPQKKQGLLAQAKKKIETVTETLKVAKAGVKDPRAFVQSIYGKLNAAKATKGLAEKQKAAAVSKSKSLAMLEDGLWLGNAVTLVGLASEAIGKQQLGMVPSVLKTLEAMDEAIASNPRLKIDRTKILEALQWALEGKIEYGKGSHLNLRYAAGVFTIPQNKDGSNNADIVYIKKAAALMTQQLRGLLLGYELSQASLTSEDSREVEEAAFESYNAISSSEERKDETPEPSGSEEDKS